MSRGRDSESQAREVVRDFSAFNIEGDGVERLSASKLSVTEFSLLRVNWGLINF